MKVKEIINLINSSNISSLGEAEDLLDDTAKLVAKDLEIERYKWFGVATNVYEVEDALTAILASMDKNALPTIKEFLYNHSYLNKEKPIEGLTEKFYNYLISHCKRNVEKNKDTRPWELIYHEHRIFLELLERVGRNFIERK